jgi:hypothetical protein
MQAWANSSSGSDSSSSLSFLIKELLWPTDLQTFSVHKDIVTQAFKQIDFLCEELEGQIRVLFNSFAINWSALFMALIPDIANPP